MQVDTIDSARSNRPHTRGSDDAEHTTRSLQWFVPGGREAVEGRGELAG